MSNVINIADVRDNVALASTLTNHIGATATSEQWGHVKLSDSVNAALTAGSGWAATPALVNAVNVNAITALNTANGIKDGTIWAKYSSNLVDKGAYDKDCGIFVGLATGNILPISLRGVGSVADNDEAIESIGTANHPFRSLTCTGHIKSLRGNCVSGSDSRIKKDIEPLDERWLKFFSLLKPSSFKYTGDKKEKTHLGFIAQDVCEAMRVCGVNPDEMAIVSWDIEEDKYMYLAYDEFISVLTLMEQNTQEELQKSNIRIHNLEIEIDTLKQELLEIKSMLKG